MVIGIDLRKISENEPGKIFYHSLFQHQTGHFRVIKRIRIGKNPAPFQSAKEYQPEGGHSKVVNPRMAVKKFQNAPIHIIIVYSIQRWLQNSFCLRLRQTGTRGGDTSSVIPSG